MSKTKDRNFISAVVYMHDNVRAVRDFLVKLGVLLHEHFEYSEIICVDDASDSSCTGAIKEAAAQVPGVAVSVIHMSFYHGPESAMKAGVDMSIGDFVFEFDSVAMDYDSNMIMKIYNHALTGFDIVSAAPDRGTLWSSQLFYRVFNRFSSSLYPLTTESFRVLSRRAVNRVDSLSDAISYRKAQYATCGLRLDTLWYHRAEKISVKKDAKTKRSRRETAVDTLILFTDITYKISLFLSILMMLFTLGTAVYTVAVYFGQRRPIEGWAPLMGLISVGLFGVFLLLTIIIKHLNLILKLIFHKQEYLVASIEKL